MEAPNSRESDFGVIAGVNGFAKSGDAVGVEAGEKNRGLHLRAGNGRRVVDCLELRRRGFRWERGRHPWREFRRPFGAAARRRVAWGGGAGTHRR